MDGLFLRKNMKYLESGFPLGGDSKRDSVFGFCVGSAKINWQFTTEDARIKLRKLYPTFEE